MFDDNLLKIFSNNTVRTLFSCFFLIFPECFYFRGQRALKTLYTFLTFFNCFYNIVKTFSVAGF